ncbi:isoprenylcysteine carboxylmethyltransferase family protein [Candidatus Azambacteria bacterium]|nr:isoprenylcysteine carboxylmethyltransferase family protein [Candidatus Azambacteria bacterium]MBI3685671.1 isoprenylcysteine carboxylmethyltransferase family protein [Candidatus Azambacteria bacterium]
MNKIITSSDSPQVIAPPPSIYLIGIGIGVVLDWLKPLPFLAENVVVPPGAVIIAISVIFIVAAFREFIKAKTNIDVRKPTTSIVSAGPYRFSRNPIYLSMTLLTIGIAVLANTLWIFVMLVPILFTIQFGVIMREEAYLTKKFGEEYLRYKARVRRWI